MTAPRAWSKVVYDTDLFFLCSLRSLHHLCSPALWESHRRCLQCPGGLDTFSNISGTNFPTWRLAPGSRTLFKESPTC